MIIVSAATGGLGRLVVECLLHRVPAGAVAVAVRNPGRADDLAARGVEVRFGDYDDLDSLGEAFTGADRLLFISSPHVGARAAQHQNVVAAARAAGVGARLYTSGLGADLIDEGVLGEHHATEQAVLASGIPHIFLRHPIYSDFFINPGLQAAIDAGELTSSPAGRGMNTATRADLAEAAAAVLTDAEPPGRAYNLTGCLWTFPQLAAVLSNVSGRPVMYRESDGDEGIMQVIGPMVRSGGFEFQTDDLTRLLGHPPTNLEDAVIATLKPLSDRRWSAPAPPLVPRPGD